MFELRRPYVIMIEICLLPTNFANSGDPRCIVMTMSAQLEQRSLADHAASAPHTGEAVRYSFTGRGRVAVAASYQAAYDRQCDFVGTEHLLLGVIADETDPIIALILGSADVPRADVRERVDAVIGQPADRPRLAHLPQTPHLQTVFRHSHDTAFRTGQSDIDTTHLACGLLATPSTASEILSQCGIDLHRLHEHLHR